MIRQTVAVASISLHPKPKKRITKRFHFSVPVAFCGHAKAQFECRLLLLENLVLAWLRGGRGQSLKHRMRVNPIPFCRNLCHKHTWISQGSSSCAAFLSPRFSFMRRFLARPAGQRWQNLQLLPLEQPAPPWKKLHGRHSPRACPFEPTFQNKSAMSTYAGMSVEDSMPAMLAGCSGPSGSATRAGCSAALGSPHQEPSASGKLGSESTGASFSELDALLSAEVSESGAVESALETSTSRRRNTEINAVQWVISPKPTVARRIHYRCVCVYICIYIYTHTEIYVCTSADCSQQLTKTRSHWNQTRPSNLVAGPRPMPPSAPREAWTCCVRGCDVQHAKDDERRLLSNECLLAL